MITLHYGDIVRIGGRRHSFGTVSGYSARYHEDQRAAIERAQNNGHKLVWLNQEAIVLAADPSTVDLSFRFELAPGDVVFIDSHHAEESGEYRVKPEGYSGYHNYQLVRV